LLADSSEITRRSARKAIVSLGSRKPLAPPPALIDLLSQGQLADSRAQAATALGAFGEGAEGTVKALILALKDGEPDVRNNAAVALQSFGPGAAPAFPGLIALLDDPFIPPPPPAAEMPISKSSSTGGGGGGGGGRGQQAVQPAKTDPPVEAARTIGRIIETQIAKSETPSPEALASLSKTLKASRPAIREAAEEALKRIGKGASSLVPALIQDLTGSIPDPEAHFGPTAATALGNIAPGSPTTPEAIAALVAALDAKAPETQSSAVVALGRFGTSGATAIPRLKEVKEANPSLATSIQTTIDRLEGKAPPEAPRRKGGRGGGGGGGARKKAG
jgi:HEAT repeat protein